MKNNDDSIYKKFVDAIKDADKQSGMMDDFSEIEGFTDYRREISKIDTNRAWRRMWWQKNRRKMVYFSSSAAAVLVVILFVLWKVYSVEQVQDALADIMPTQSVVTLKLSTGELIDLEHMSRLSSLDVDETISSSDIVLRGVSIDTINGSLFYPDTIGKAAKTEAIVYDELSLSKGKAYSLTLSDGTKVYLNSESTLKYPVSFKAGERRVFLSGEAFFEVAHDEGRPFVVETSDYDVLVLGTRFDVSAYPDESVSSTTLIDGSVVISKQMSGNLGSNVNILINKEYNVTEKLIPGEQFRYNLHEGVSSISKVDSEDYISWIDNVLTMKRMNLKEILIKLERRYDFTFTVSEKASKEVFSGRLPMNENLCVLLEQLAMVSDFRYYIDGNHITIE